MIKEITIKEIKEELARAMMIVQNVMEAMDETKTRIEMFSDFIAKYFDLTSHKSLRNKSRGGDGMYALKFAIVFVKAYYKASFEDLGQLYYRDHATIRHHFTDMIKVIKLGRDKRVMETYFNLLAHCNQHGYSIYKIKSYVEDYDFANHISELKSKNCALRTRDAVTID